MQTHDDDIGAVAFAVIVILYLLAATIDPCDNAPGCNPTTINQ